MNEPPRVIGGAQLLRWSVIDERHRHNGNCRQIVGGELQGPAAGLAICRSKGEKGCYLFGCDEQWNTITDTWHESLEDALQQAEFEYEGITKTWNLV